MRRSSADAEDRMRGLAAVMTVRQQHLMQSERARNAISTCRARSEQWRTGTGVSADTKKLWRPSHNDDTDSAWKDEAVVFRNHPELVRSRAQDGSKWDVMERDFISSRLKQPTRLSTPITRTTTPQPTAHEQTKYTAEVHDQHESGTNDDDKDVDTRFFFSQQIDK